MLQTTLDPAAISAREARRFVMDALHRLALESYADAATLLVSELVTNAVLHAGGPVTLRVLARSSLLRVEVEDESAAIPVQRHFGAEAATGRGLLLVEAMAHEWGTTSTPTGGKVVWFELALEEAA